MCKFSQREGVLCINLDRDAHLGTFAVYPKKNRLQISNPQINNSISGYKNCCHFSASIKMSSVFSV